MRCSMARIHAGRCADAAGEVAGRDHDRRRAVGDRRDVGVAQRVMRDGLREHLLGGGVAFADRDRVLHPRCAATRAATSARSFSVAAARVEIRAGLQRGHVDHRRPQRQRVVRVGLQRHDLVQVAGRRLAEAVHERACRPRRSGSRPTPRRAPTPRPSRRGSRAAAATRPPRRARSRTRTDHPAGSRGCPSTRIRCRACRSPTRAIAACTVGHDHLGLVVLRVDGCRRARERDDRHVSHEIVHVLACSPALSAGDARQLLVAVHRLSL